MFVLLTLTLVPVASFAQSAVDPDQARLRLGPFGITPRFAVRDLGVDTNVFNTSQSPRRDVVAVLAPGADYGIRIARVLLSGKTSLDWNYFQRERSQRSANVSQEGRVDPDLGVLAPHVEGAYFRTRQRPNQEVDLRVPQRRHTAAAGLGVHIGPRTALDAGAKVDTVRFDPVEQDGQRIATALNRDTHSISVSLKRSLTALTTWTLRADLVQDRFQQSSQRDTDSRVVSSQFDFQPSAFVSGTARVGIRQLTAASDIAPNFSGVIAAINLNYVLLEQTRFSVKFDRDVEYSSEDLWPYYVLDAGTLEVRQAVGFVWDVVGRYGRSRLDYRAFSRAAGPPDLNVKRLDGIRIIGGGMGRHLSDDVRVGIDVNHEERRSPVAERSYRRYRVGGSVTYGF